MKKKTAKKLSLKMIKVAQLNDSGAQFILGGNAGSLTPPVTTSRTTGPSGPPTGPVDPCASATCTVACPHGWSR
ncbi:hypothetical protein [Chitinophaga eiseniae]|uniref:hypothetical protein n=1 Tax=Chitinophaga eiseniae TaxID=634771 RepID=UPI001177829C|nr:hypothetical protein [Chitinophaga eiseniae]